MFLTMRCSNLIGFILILIKLSQFSSGCVLQKELARTSDSNIIEFIRYLNCSENAMPFDQCIAECMRLEACDAITYSSTCEICIFTYERYSGTLNTNRWLVNSNSPRIAILEGESVHNFIC